MNNTGRRMLVLFIFAMMAQTLLGCDYVAATLLAPSAPPEAIIVVLVTPHPAYSEAQATIDAGQNQLLDVARQGSQLDIQMAQTEDASAQSNQDANLNKKSELELQATRISLNIAHAAATQEFLSQQTQIAADAISRAQDQAVATSRAAGQALDTQTAQALAIQEHLDLQTVQAGATQAALPLTATFAAREQNATATVQAHELLMVQATQAARAQLTGTAYPLTATPLALTQSALLMQQYGREQQSFTDQVVTPLIPIFVVLILVLLTLGIVWVYRWFIPLTWPRRLPAARVNYHLSPMTVIDGVIANSVPRPPPKIPLALRPAASSSLSAMDQVHVEIVNATESPVSEWIAEVEERMKNAEKGAS